MAESPAFESPVVRSYEFSSGGPLMLADASGTTKWLVRGEVGGAAADRMDAPFGSSRDAGGGACVLGSRPGEWIVVGPADAVAGVVVGLDGLDASEFVTALDWTHGRALFLVTGTDAPRMLEKVCSLDWSDAMTPDGAVASASVAKVICDVARCDSDGTPTYMIFCDRSFGQYLFDALIDAGEEFGLAVGLPNG
ncbi:MAG: hypothetical protein F4076_01550 [Acidimicrobiaceae bacterium]|nr:hypothetical protein [Acidimicrobiaceae bacterium]